MPDFRGLALVKPASPQLASANLGTHATKREPWRSALAANFPQAMNRDVVFCRIMLARVRQEAKEMGVPIPKRLTALRSGSGKAEGFYLVEGSGFRKEVSAHNAFDARYKVISSLVDAWCKANPDVDRK